MNHNLKNYKKVEAETTDPLKLIIMLYEGAINFTEQAKLRLQDNKVADKGILISKVLAIISELQSSLNLKDGGEFAINMDRIYNYLRDRLMEANTNNDVSILDEMVSHMRILKDAWVQARDKTSQEAAHAVPQEQVPEAAKAQSIPAPQPDPSPRVEEKVDAQPAIEIVG